jgi:zinc transporter ZupT
MSIELWMRSKMPDGGAVHNHGSATGEEFSGHHPSSSSETGAAAAAATVQSPDKVSSEDALWLRDQVRVDGGPRPFSMSSGDSDIEKLPLAVTTSRTAEEPETNRSFGLVDLDPETVDPMIYKKMSMEITLLEGGILFHSIFVGMTISITTNGFIILLTAILFHQTFEGLGLGSRIAAVPYPKGSIKPYLLIFAFGTTAPIGQAIGLIAHNSYDPNSAFALILVGFFNAVSVPHHISLTLLLIEN